MRRLLLSSLQKPTFDSIKKDFVASLTVTAIAVPESLGLAVIAGLPLEAGLYTAIIAPFVYAFFASSKRLVVGADSATAAIVAAGAGLVATAGEKEYVSAVATLGLLVGFMLMLASIMKLGFLASLVSRPVLLGMFAGIGIQLMSSKLPDMFGTKSDGDLVGNIVSLIHNIPSINGMTVTISVLVLGIILIFRRVPRVPGEIVGLVAACVFAFIFHVQDYGVTTIGMLPSGIPELTIPYISFESILTLIPAALTISLVVLAQSAVTLKCAAADYDEKADVNRDLMALGVANVAAAFGRGFVANGSPPRTMAASMRGGSSQMVNIFTALLILTLLLFGTPLLAYVPTAALAAVVFAIGLHLFRYEELLYLWSRHKSEFFVAVTALIAVTFLGVWQGIFIAIAVSLVERLSRQYRPKDQVLLKDGIFSAWAKTRLVNHAQNTEKLKGILIYSFEGSLFFETIDYFVSRLQKVIDSTRDTVHYVVVDAGPIDSIDYTASESMKQFYRRLSADNIKLGFAHVSPYLTRQMDLYGITDLVGSQNIYPTLDAALSSLPGREFSTVNAMKRLNLPDESYVLIGGAVLEVLGLRDVKDIDIVVDEQTYARFRDMERWTEYRLESGKNILSKDGFNLMRSWRGHHWKTLMSDAITVKGLRLMNLSRLIEVKKSVGRRKDLADIRLIESYLSRPQKSVGLRSHHDTKESKRP